MKGQKRIRDFGITIGKLEPGDRNSITDISGILVGHSTINTEHAKTGVTAILPHKGNIFKNKVMAACHVINGFGKTMGTIQLEELGNIETPIILTNTLSIGVAADALIEYMLKNNSDIGIHTGTVNPIVCECNDGFLNDIRGGHVKKENIFEAIKNSNDEFEEGSVGAGTGMSCYGMKGGIGTSSRKITIDSNSYTLGALVLSNFGTKEDLLIDRIKAGKIISEIKNSYRFETDKGSIIVIIATDIPATERQLKRICKRAAVGISRTGSYIGNGSGDIVIGFSTANKVRHYEEEGITSIGMINENMIDLVFRAVSEATEEAILNSLICSDTIMGRDGNMRHSLREYIDILNLNVDI